MTVLIRETRSGGRRGRRCDKRCYDGKGSRCRCICGGNNHGKGLEKAVEETRRRFDIFADQNGVEQLFLKPAREETMNRSKYEIVGVDHGAPSGDFTAVIIRDIGHTDHKTVTNDAENVVADLVNDGKLLPGMRLYYYDSEGQLDEIKVKDGRFAGFAPGPRRTA